MRAAWFSLVGACQVFDAANQAIGRVAPARGAPHEGLVLGVFVHQQSRQSKVRAIGANATRCRWPTARSSLRRLAGAASLTARIAGSSGAMNTARPLAARARSAITSGCAPRAMAESVSEAFAERMRFMSGMENGPAGLVADQRGIST